MHYRICMDIPTSAKYGSVPYLSAPVVDGLCPDLIALLDYSVLLLPFTLRDRAAPVHSPLGDECSCCKGNSPSVAVRFVESRFRLFDKADSTSLRFPNCPIAQLPLHHFQTSAIRSARFAPTTTMRDLLTGFYFAVSISFPQLNSLALHS